MKQKSFIFLSVTFILITAFTVIRPLTDFDQLRNKTVQATLVQEFNSEYYAPKYYPDTTLLFNDPETDNKSTSKKFILKSLTSSGLPNVWAFANIFAPDSYPQAKEFNDKFKTTFGKGLHGKHVQMAQKNYDNKPDIFFFYSSDGIKAAFDKLYTKPTNTFEKITYQQLYNLTAKEYTRDLTRFFVYLMSKKQIWLEVSNHYLNNAKANKNFNVHKEEEYAFKKLFPTEKSQKQFPNLSEEMGAYELSSLIRRQCDGSLPTLLNCLKTVLKDYDPEALKLIKGSF